MTLRPLVILFGIVGLIASAYLLLPSSTTLSDGLGERHLDGPLFAIAIAVVSVMLLAASRQRDPSASAARL